MALTAIQRDVCLLLAAARRAHGESYVAGGVALSVALQTQRLSRDLDLFHDTTDAVVRSWDRDRETLVAAGYGVAEMRQRPGYIQAVITEGNRSLVAEWARDSAFRFFPLVDHDELGLTLHPFDLATNKVLALIGRVEARDWVDVLSCDERLQPLGYLAWAASGKDPGFSPHGILEEARRTSRYSAAELEALAFEGPAPEAGALARHWRRALAEAKAVIAQLPAAVVGQAVLTTAGQLFGGDHAALRAALNSGGLMFHAGRIGGALPRIVR
jgi:hypothetical protein